ncbi:hypothetical protein Tco_1076479 [Tanacetum coccineum]
MSKGQNRGICPMDIPLINVESPENIRVKRRFFTMKMEILLEPTSNKLLDNLKMEMEMEIPSTRNVK